MPFESQAQMRAMFASDNPKTRATAKRWAKKYGTPVEKADPFNIEKLGPATISEQAVHTKRRKADGTLADNAIDSAVISRRKDSPILRRPRYHTVLISGDAMKNPGRNAISGAEPKRTGFRRVKTAEKVYGNARKTKRLGDLKVASYQDDRKVKKAAGAAGLSAALLAGKKLLAKPKSPSKFKRGYKAAGNPQANVKSTSYLMGANARKLRTPAALGAVGVGGVAAGSASEKRKQDRIFKGIEDAVANIEKKRVPSRPDVLRIKAKKTYGVQDHGDGTSTFTRKDSATLLRNSRTESRRYYNQTGKPAQRAKKVYSTSNPTVGRLASSDDVTVQGGNLRTNTKRAIAGAGVAGYGGLMYASLKPEKKTVKKSDPFNIEKWKGETEKTGPSAGRLFWGAAAPGIHGAVAGKPNRKGEAIANELVGSVAGPLGAGVGTHRAHKMGHYKKQAKKAKVKKSDPFTIEKKSETKYYKPRSKAVDEGIDYGLKQGLGAGAGLAGSAYGLRHAAGARPNGRKALAGAAIGTAGLVGMNRADKTAVKRGVLKPDPKGIYEVRAKVPKDKVKKSDSRSAFGIEH